MQNENKSHAYLLLQSIENILLLFEFEITIGNCSLKFYLSFSLLN